MRALSFQKIYLLSFLVFLSFFITTINALAECPPGFIHPKDYKLQGGGCVRISTLSEQQKAVITRQAAAEAAAGAGSGQAQNAAPPDCSQDSDFVGPPDPRCAEEQEQKKQEEAISACQSAHDSAWQTACDASFFSPAIMAMLQAFKSADTTGDIQAACKKNKELTKWALGINATSLGVCLFALKKCTGACGAAAQYDPSAAQLASNCSSKRNWTLMIGGPSVLLNLKQVIDSADCSDGNEAGGHCAQVSQRHQDCLANSRASGSACTQINRELTECITGAQQQNGPCADLAGNALMECLGIDNVTPPPPRPLPDAPDPKRTRNNGPSTAGVPDPRFDPTDFLNDEPVIQAEYTGDDDPPAGSVSLASTPGGSGGGGLGGAGGGGAGNTDGEGEEGEGPYEEDVDPGIDTDILGDVSNSRGGSSGFGGSGYQGKGKGTGFGKNLKGFAFPKNFFDKKKANKAGRNVAGVEGADEITSANGLSNFQKVSRTINARRQTVFK